MSVAITLIGPHAGASGYDTLTRGIMTGLRDAHVAVRSVGVPSWSPDLVSSPIGADESSDPIAPPTTSTRSELALHVMMPDRTQPIPGMLNANLTMFEADRIPSAWVDRAVDFDLIILPTPTCREAWRTSGVPEDKLRVCGLGVDAERFARPMAPLPLTDHTGRPLATYRHRFLHVGEPRPRKNQLGLLRAWLRATSRADDAVLIMKWPGAGGLAAAFSADVSTVERQVGRALADAAPVVIVTEVLSDGDMSRLYRSATHYVNLSHGEGWDLPMMEAAASGLSLIAPDQPTYRSYLQQPDADWVPCILAPARREGEAGAEDLVYFEGLQWWQPDEAAAADVISAFVAGKAGCPPPQQRMLAEHSWTRVGQRLLGLLTELVESPTRTRG